ncbi:MAG: redox-regulated ATPase YchF [Chloroflexi bacterium]|nr:redox-regulated ATPase YchF [Chloroflexota bacterium]
MSLQIGIVGLPNVGKSTLFNAMTRAQAAVANYPFTTIEPNVGVAAVSDPRLERLAELVQPERTVPAAVEFVDIAGLVKGASQGAGLGNQFLGHIRNVDAMAMVVRAFANPDIPHVTAELDPLDDVETVELELILADLATVERRMESVRAKAKAQPREYQAELDLLERLSRHLDAGRKVREMSLGDREAHLLQPLNLLTAKPCLYVVNVSEETLPDGGPWAAAVAQRAAAEGTEAVVICAELEAGLAAWPTDEADAYRAELGLAEPGLDRLIAAGYRLLNLITFFTVTGKKETRAWPLAQGRTAWEAAGLIHTDMQRGFIRAEAIPWSTLLQAGGLVAAREAGLVRLEGRDYVVQDGDVMHIRFSR